MHLAKAVTYRAHKNYLTVSYRVSIFVCSECSGFLFFHRLHKKAVLVIYHLRGCFVNREKCILHVNKEVIKYDYEVYKSEEKERRKTNENQFKFQEPIKENKN